MSYVMPFALLKKKFPALNLVINDQSTDAERQVVELIKIFLGSVKVNDKWYAEAYPDVMEAIAEGIYSSPKRHFVEHGYFEGRSPDALEVDEEWYMQTYPDLAAGIKSQRLKSATDHFMEFGMAEGRMPSPY
jgi:hypothetical protein